MNRPITSRNRPPQRLTAVGIFLVAGISICACEGKQVDVDSANRATLPARAAGHSPNSTDSSIPAGSKAVKKECGGREMRLITESVSSESERIGLYFIPPDGTTVELAQPDEMDGNVPVGLACAFAANDKKPYFIVQFGQRPAGCRICEWFYLYDGGGKQLTRSNPPVIKDETLPPAEQEYPNNDEYQALIEKLGIQHPQVSYID